MSEYSFIVIFVQSISDQLVSPDASKPGPDPTSTNEESLKVPQLLPSIRSPTNCALAAVSIAALGLCSATAAPAEATDHGPRIGTPVADGPIAGITSDDSAQHRRRTIQGERHRQSAMVVLLKTNRQRCRFMLIP
jgi:hypothetical protein